MKQDWLVIRCVGVKGGEREREGERKRGRKGETQELLLSFVLFILGGIYRLYGKFYTINTHTLKVTSKKVEDKSTNIYSQRKEIFILQTQTQYIAL